MNNKKILAGFAALAIIGAISLTSCQDTLEEQYLNPEKTTEASIGKFLTTMLDNRRVRADYWNIRTFLLMHPAVYTNLASYTNSNDRYQQQLNYLDDLWKDYYTPNYYDQNRPTGGAGGIVAHMREIERQYEALSAEEKADADVFLHAARIVYYDQTAQMVDLFGDIPFSEAGKLNLTGDMAMPKFDDAEDIYTALLAGLETSAAYFATATPAPPVATAFTSQDILLRGNLDKWRRYANSIRLRLLMHISFQNEGAAQADVMEMLNNPAAYPLVDEATHNVLLTRLNNYTDNMRNAVTELLSHHAPEFLLDEVLKPANDPRIRVLFDKNVNVDGEYNADYFSMPADIPSSEQEENISQRRYAILDSATFIVNTSFPGIVITSAEVNFLKAEAYERWGSTAQAQAAYEKAVTQAVEFVFYLNGLGASFAPASQETPVTPGEITALLASPTVAYTGTKDEKLAKIGTQKWLSFGFMQSAEAWTEVRRTGYPALTFVPDNSAPAASQLPPDRLLYPGTEKVYNAENYEAVSGRDTPNTKIFWDVQ